MVFFGLNMAESFAHARVGYIHHRGMDFDTACRGQWLVHCTALGLKMVVLPIGESDNS